MAKFTPSEHVEALEYDFTDYGGGSGTITEPSTKAVNDFFRGIREMIKEVSALRDLVQDSSVEEMSDEKMVETLAKFSEGDNSPVDAIASAQSRTIEMVAMLCGAQRVDDDSEEGYTLIGGSPSKEELEKLPYRVLQAFNSWLMDQIRPKRTTPGTKR